MNELNSNARPKRGLKKWLLAFLMVLLAGAGLAAWVTGGFKRELRYQGKPASYWLDLTDNAKEDWKPSDTAFEVMGGEAVPFLIKTLERRPTWLVRKISEFASKHNLPDWLERRLPNTYHWQLRRKMAAHYISKLGPVAEAAIPTLWRVLEDPNEDSEVKPPVRGALASMGEMNVILLPEFIRCLTNGYSDIRIIAAESLGALSRNARPAVPALVKALRNPVPSMRKAASDALTHLVTSPDDWVPTFGVLLQDSRTRAETFDSLFILNPGGEKTAAMLTEVFATATESEQQQVLYLLERIGPQARPAMPTLIAVLSNSDNEIRYLAVRVLKAIGPEARAAIPALTERLKDENDLVANAATKAIKTIDSPTDATK